MEAAKKQQVRTARTNFLGDAGLPTGAAPSQSDDVSCCDVVHMPTDDVRILDVRFATCLFSQPPASRQPSTAASDMALLLSVCKNQWSS